MTHQQQSVALKQASTTWHVQSIPVGQQQYTWATAVVCVKLHATTVHTFLHAA